MNKRRECSGHSFSMRTKRTGARRGGYDGREVQSMKTIEEMKSYIEERGMWERVIELIHGVGADRESAIEYVYDGVVLQDDDFLAKYFGIVRA